MKQGRFGIRLRVSGTRSAQEVLDGFICQAGSRTEIEVASHSGDEQQAEAVITVPWAYKEQARIDWNIYSAEVEEHETGARLELESWME